MTRDENEKDERHGQTWAAAMDRVEALEKEIAVLRRRLLNLADSEAACIESEIRANAATLGAVQNMQILQGALESILETGDDDEDPADDLAYARAIAKKALASLVRTTTA